MFQALRYLLFTSLYKKAKKSFTMLFVYVVSLILISLMLNDLISISTGAVVYILLLVKWSVVLSLLSLIAFSIIKIFNIALNPFEMKQGQSSKKSKKSVLKDARKDRILTKEKLFTKSDLILQKYMKDQ